MFQGRRKTLVLLICGSAAVLLTAMALVGPHWGVIIGMALAIGLGMTIASYASVMQTVAVESVPRAQTGSAMGGVMIGLSLGAMAGPPLFGAVVDFTGQFADGWLTTAVIVATGLVILKYKYKEGAEQTH